jgi:hypothetical protein
MDRKGVITALKRMRGRYLGDGFTSVQVVDLLNAITGVNEQPGFTILNGEPELYAEMDRHLLKKGNIVCHPNGRDYRIEKVERTEQWPSRALIAHFVYSHEADGSFYYKAPYTYGYRVIQGIRDPGETVAYLSVTLLDEQDPTVAIPCKIFVRVI